MLCLLLLMLLLLLLLLRLLLLLLRLLLLCLLLLLPWYVAAGATCTAVAGVTTGCRGRLVPLVPRLLWTARS